MSFLSNFDILNSMVQSILWLVVLWATLGSTWGKFELNLHVITLKLANCSTLTRSDRIRCSLIDFAILTTMMQSVSWNKIVWIASRLLDFDIYETECAVYFLPSSDNWLMRRISFNQIWHSELNVQSISWSEDILIDFNNDRGFSTSICVSLHLISIDSDI